MCTRPQFIAGRAFPVPCGKCLECVKSYNNMWAQRIVDEASLYVDNCILTLTYAETDGNLCKKDLQDFIKRLRFHLSKDGIKIRYFGCGEYGGKGNRPHFHLIIFGWKPHDLVFVCEKKKIKYYGSLFVEDIWKHGYVSVGDVTISSAKYCAKYMSKLDKRPHEVKPFTVMSRKPGIGFGTINFNMLITGKRYFDGKIYSLPKYYLDKCDELGYNTDIIRLDRTDFVKRKYGDYYDVKEVAIAKKRDVFNEKKLFN